MCVVHLGMVLRCDHAETKDGVGGRIRELIFAIGKPNHVVKGANARRTTEPVQLSYTIATTTHNTRALSLSLVVHVAEAS